MTTSMKKFLSLEDFEKRAKQVLPRPISGYIHAATEERRSYDSNINAFKKYAFVPRVFVNISNVDTSVELFGKRYAQPFGLSPVGLAALLTYRGDVTITNAAAARNVPMIMSGSSLIRLEEVAEANPDAWFQGYIPGDAEKLEPLIERIKQSKFRTLVLTVDTPVNPNKENLIRTGFSTPLRMSPSLIWQGVSHPGWLCNTFLKTLIKHGIPHFENNYATRGVAVISKQVERDFSDRGRLTWDSLVKIRKMWSHTLIVKGVLSPEDAATAADLGVDGIIISNHGGRQLDGAIAPLDILPRVVERCPSIPIMIDGGVRRGADVLKCLALGAKFVFLGRPFVYAASAAGKPGVERAIDLLAAEVHRDMAMLGVTRIADLNSNCLVRSS
jgi:L-lactate dehydrogenase (cytochrome)